MIYQLRVNGSPLNEYVGRDEAIREAEDYVTAGNEASVVAVEQSGDYTSRTQVWPTIGETYSS
jgi:hypothetical protein